MGNTSNTINNDSSETDKVRNGSSLISILPTLSVNLDNQNMLCDKNTFDIQNKSAVTTFVKSNNKHVNNDLETNAGCPTYHGLFTIQIDCKLL